MKLLSILNKKILNLSFLVVPIILGSGFCFWSFTGSNLSNENSIELSIDQSEEVGEFDIISAPSLLIFGSGLTEDKIDSGLTFYESYKSDKTSKEEVRLNNELNIEYYENELDINEEYDLFLGIKISFNTSSFLYDYLKINEDYLDNINDEEYIPFSSFATYIVNSDKETHTFKDGNSYECIKHSLSISLNKLIEYKSIDVKPITKDEYKKLYELINNSKSENTNYINISLKATINRK